MIGVILAVLARPRLWLPALRAAARVRRRGGLTPSREWWRWRLHTAYGDDRSPRTEDIVAWLSWCRSFERRR